MRSEAQPHEPLHDGEDIGPLLQPSLPLEENGPGGQFVATVTEEMLYPRWPNLHGGHLLACAEAAAELAVIEHVRELSYRWRLLMLDHTFIDPVLTNSARPRAIFLRATPMDLVDLGPQVRMHQLTVRLQMELDGTLIGETLATFLVEPGFSQGSPHERMRAYLQSRPERLILPTQCHIIRPGKVTGAWTHRMPLTAIADSVLADAMKSWRGEGMSDHDKLHYVVYQCSIVTHTNVLVGSGAYDAEVLHVGRGTTTFASVIGTLNNGVTPGLTVKGTLKVTRQRK